MPVNRLQIKKLQNIKSKLKQIKMYIIKYKVLIQKSNNDNDYI